MKTEREKLIERSKVDLECLPDAPYKTMMTQLHADMLDADGAQFVDMHMVYQAGFVDGKRAILHEMADPKISEVKK